MKVVIIEDEAFAALRLKKMIQDYNPEIRIVAELESVVKSRFIFPDKPQISDKYLVNYKYGSIFPRSSEVGIKTQSRR